jgi:hypothetical protein
MSTCKKCGCEDKFLTPAPCPDPIGCPEPEPCSELFDAQCVQYNGEDITCGEETIVPTNTDLATALNSIADLACNPTIPVANKYVQLFDSEIPGRVQSTLVNITGPVTYEWSFADNAEDFTFSGPTNLSYVNLVSVATLGHSAVLADTAGTASTKSWRMMTLLKLKVTDAAGNVYRDTFFYIQTIGTFL